MVPLDPSRTAAYQVVDGVLIPPDKFLGPPELDSSVDPRYSLGSYDPAKDRHPGDLYRLSGISQVTNPDSTFYTESVEDLSDTSSSAGASRSSVDIARSFTEANTSSYASLDQTPRNGDSDAVSVLSNTPISPPLAPMADRRTSLALSDISSLDQDQATTVVSPTPVSQSSSLHRRLSQLKRKASNALKKGPSLTIDTGTKTPRTARFAEATSVNSPIEPLTTTQLPRSSSDDASPRSKKSFRSTWKDSRAGQGWRKWANKLSVSRADSTARVDEPMQPQSASRKKATGVWWNRTLSGMTRNTDSSATTRPTITHVTHDDARNSQAPITEVVPSESPPGSSITGLRSRLPSASDLKSGARAILSKVPGNWRSLTDAWSRGQSALTAVPKPTYLPPNTTNTDLDTGLRSDAVGGHAAKRASNKYRWSTGWTTATKKDQPTWRTSPSVLLEKAKSFKSWLVSMSMPWSRSVPKGQECNAVLVTTEVDFAESRPAAEGLKNPITRGASLGRSHTDQTLHSLRVDSALGGASVEDDATQSFKRESGLGIDGTSRAVVTEEIPMPSRSILCTEMFPEMANAAESAIQDRVPSSTILNDESLLRYRDYMRQISSRRSLQPVIEGADEFATQQPSSNIHSTDTSERGHIPDADLSIIGGGIQDSVSVPSPSSIAGMTAQQSVPPKQDNSSDMMFALDVANGFWRGAVSRGQAESTRLGGSEDASVVNHQQSILDGISAARSVRDSL